MPSWYTNPSVAASPSVGGAPPSGGGNPFGWDIAGEVGDAIASWLQNATTEALGPVAEIWGGMAPHTPDLTGEPQVRQVWTAALVVVDTSFVLLIVIAGVQVAGRESVQTRQAAKQFAPRFLVAMVAAHCNLPVIAEAIRLTNAVCAALGAASHTPLTKQALDQIGDLELSHGESFLGNVLGAGVIVMLIAAILTFLIRLALLVALIAAAPLAMACWALPQTDGVARLWCRGLAALLGIQIAQTLVLTAFLRVFLVPKHHLILGVPADKNGILNLLICLMLLWILVKIPGWAKKLVFRQPIVPLPGRLRLPRTLVNVVKGVVLAKTLGAVGLLGHRGARTAATAAGVRRGGWGGPRPGPPRPGTPRAPRPRPTGPPPPAHSPGLVRPAGRPAPAMFSAAPTIQTPLASPAGATSGPRFSTAPSGQTPLFPPAPGTGGPPSFSHALTTQTATAPAAGRAGPPVFSHAPSATPVGPPTTRAGTPIIRAGTPAAPLRPAFSDAPAHHSALRRPPAPARPVFTDAPPLPPPRRRGVSRPDPPHRDPSEGGDRS